MRSQLKPKLRFEILRRDRNMCQMCGRTPRDGVKLEIDHKIAVANGGTNQEHNLWTLCFDCNRGKSALALDPGFMSFAEQVEEYLSLNRNANWKFNHISVYQIISDVRFRDPIFRCDSERVYIVEQILKMNGYKIDVDVSSENFWWHRESDV